ncbi:MAG TPA: hypothetical protein VNM90_04720 [Haliangium sp.]|nr:hypothetical protein [Haliangium sp.]
MADKYIDHREVVEYGRHFLAEVRRLIGLSAVVDIAALQRIVQAVVEAMEAALGVAQVQRSGVRTGRAGASGAAADTLEALRRFHYHLKALPPGTVFDRDAFFDGLSMDALARLKPADLLARADHAVHGFGVPANAGLPGAADWLPAILDARDALAAAITGKQASRGSDKDAAGSLSEIRARFLHVYNGMAKRLVWAVLLELGRLDEYKRYFLDLQVNEGGRRPGDEPEAPGAGPETPTA